MKYKLMKNYLIILKLKKKFMCLSVYFLLLFYYFFYLRKKLNSRQIGISRFQASTLIFTYILIHFVSLKNVLVFLKQNDNEN